MRRILVLRGGALGDFIVTLPALELLRQRWPQARLELAGNTTAAALAVRRGWLDAAHSQHEARWSALFAPGDTPLPAELAAWLADFDLVISYWPDPDGDLSRRFPINSRQTFVSAPAMPTLRPAAAHYCAALRALGIHSTQTFAALAPLKAAAPDVLQERPIAIHPGSGSTRKNWPLPRWLALITQLRVPVRLILGEAEIEHWKGREPELPNARFLVNLPLEDLVATLVSCRLFLGHDSGISHLAAACGVPCILLFGPTDPLMWAPPSPGVHVLQSNDLTQLSVADVLRTVTPALADQT